MLSQTEAESRAPSLGLPGDGTPLPPFWGSQEDGRDPADTCCLPGCIPEAEAELGLEPRN